MGKWGDFLPTSPPVMLSRFFMTHINNFFDFAAGVKDSKNIATFGSCCWQNEGSADFCANREF